MEKFTFCIMFIHFCSSSYIEFVVIVLFTVKALINAGAFIRIATFHREGGWELYKRLECLQSIT